MIKLNNRFTKFCEIVDPENIMLLIVIKLKSAHSELLERIKQL